MYGLVLEGGGAKGAYQIGAYKALEELGIAISGVAGTSIGAINGALIAQGDAAEAYELWYNISPSKVFDVNEEYLHELRNLELTAENMSYFFHKAKDVLNNRGFNTALMRRILNENIIEKKLRNTKMDFGFITVSLTDMKPLEIFLEDIPEGQIIDYLMASASLPVFRLDKLDGKVYLDGAFYDNLPINLLLQRGYRDLIVIRTHGLGFIRKVNSQDANLIYIDPWRDLGNILDFDQNTARKNLKLGYFDALRVFKGLKGREYYVWAKNDEKYFIEFLIGLGENNVLAAGKTLGFEHGAYKTMLFEQIIPRLAELLGADKYGGYEDITVLLLEALAHKLDIERFRTYKFEEFLTAIQGKLKTEPFRSVKNIPAFIKKNELLAKAIKDNLVEEVMLKLLTIK